VGKGASRAACLALLAAEAFGTLLLWAPLPFAWIWVGGRVYAVTGSLFLDGAVALTGFAASALLAMRGLARLDRTWIALRRRAGYAQSDGALTQVVVISATLGLAGFLVWYYVLSHAFILPFMPSQ
jgi:hypothetical protein